MYIITYIRTCMYIVLASRGVLDMYVSTNVCACMYGYTCTCTYTCTYMYTYVCMYVIMYIHVRTCTLYVYWILFYSVLASRGVLER